MQQETSDNLTELLRERMEDLLYEVVEMQDYLSAEVVAGGGAKLPLGSIGRVMSSDLQYEALNMLEKTEEVICKAEADSWEKNRTALYLNRKLSALEVFMRIIAQLPASSPKEHRHAEVMAGRVQECCQQVEQALMAVGGLAAAKPA